MTFDYAYPRFTEGFRWNVHQRTEFEVGLRCVGVSDNGLETVVHFDRELTAPEKSLLDTLMASSPTQPPPASGSRFIIRDIYDQRSTIGTAMGFTYRLYYSESVPGSGNVDQIEIHFDEALSTPQRNRVLSEFAKIIEAR